MIHWYKGKTNDGEELQIEDLEIFENVAYIMAFHADPTIPGTIEEWLDEFDIRMFADLPDVLTVPQISAATGYNVRTVGQWLRRGRMRYLMLDRAYHVPKVWVIDYLCSELHNATHRKSPQHVAALWAAYEGGVTA